ncbi:STAS domain-containing protein [Vreelandella azerica]|uniref:STAS domain-containing protein n=1 Tax=Vreelandella azerica TaxID=2732867 RepID=UPI002E2B22ED|nr:STAS domain-containing protein [Halomonas azerica]
MSEARHFVRTLRSAPFDDVAILVTCFGLTVIFDMVLAVGVGIALAAALFIRRMALLTQSDRVDTRRDISLVTLPDGVAVYNIDGPLFFGAAEKALASLRVADPTIKTLILDMHDVPSMDVTGIMALEALLDDMARDNVRVILVGLKARMILKLRRAGIHKVPGQRLYCQHMTQAIKVARRWQG